MKKICYLLSLLFCFQWAESSENSAKWQIAGSKHRHSPKAKAKAIVRMDPSRTSVANSKEPDFLDTSTSFEEFTKTGEILDKSGQKYVLLATNKGFSLVTEPWLKEYYRPPSEKKSFRGLGYGEKQARFPDGTTIQLYLDDRDAVIAVQSRLPENKFREYLMRRFLQAMAESDSLRSPLVNYDIRSPGHGSDGIREDVTNLNALQRLLVRSEECMKLFIPIGKSVLNTALVRKIGTAPKESLAKLADGFSLILSHWREKAPYWNYQEFIISNFVHELRKKSAYGLSEADLERKMEMLKPFLPFWLRHGLLYEIFSLDGSLYINYANRIVEVANHILKPDGDHREHIKFEGEKLDAGNSAFVFEGPRESDLPLEYVAQQLVQSVLNRCAERLKANPRNCVQYEKSKGNWLIDIDLGENYLFFPVLPVEFGNMHRVVTMKAPEYDRLPSGKYELIGDGSVFIDTTVVRIIVSFDDVGGIYINSIYPVHVYDLSSVRRPITKFKTSLEVLANDMLRVFSFNPKTMKKREQQIWEYLEERFKENKVKEGVKKYEKMIFVESMFTFPFSPTSPIFRSMVERKYGVNEYYRYAAELGDRVIIRGKSKLGTCASILRFTNFLQIPKKYLTDVLGIKIETLLRITGFDKDYTRYLFDENGELEENCGEYSIVSLQSVIKSKRGKKPVAVSLPDSIERAVVEEVEMRCSNPTRLEFNTLSLAATPFYHPS